VGSAVENAAAALVEIQSPQTPESQKACVVDFGAAAAAIQAENEDDIATAQLLDILWFSRNLRAVCWYFSAAILTLRGL